MNPTAKHTSVTDEVSVCARRVDRGFYSRTDNSWPQGSAQPECSANPLVTASRHADGGGGHPRMPVDWPTSMRWPSGSRM
jgi:hypothetical protein